MSDSPRISLPVIPQKPRPIRASRMARWRALVLILVYVVFTIHIVQWLLTGLTLSPVEPSESMQTLEQGVVNAGFIFFLLAIISTLLFGRFFCGWGCHIVALQDLCAWLMRRAGVKPKPFRSRLLVYAPLVFGLYMFAWPSFKRLAIKPALSAMDIPYPSFLGEAPDPHGLTTALLVPDFWATFPPWYVAIPFFAVCGFGAVYFLGAKGFCTYACPYGGIFGPADVVSPVRIRVTDACEHCGHCTAVCTSNVRVHEEVRDFGMVVDPGCMKCMDCVSVCPNEALYLGIGKPALGAKPRSPEAARTHQQALTARRRRFDLSGPEEVAFAAIFVALFLAFRGMLDLVPMLMAIGMAGIGTFLLVSAWGVLRKPNVRLQSHQLKLKGRIKPLGAVTLGAGALVLAVAGWSGHARAHRWLADLAYRSYDTPVDVVLRDDFAPTRAERARARRALSHARAGDAFSEGGYAWPLDADANLRVAYLALIDGQDDLAEHALHRVIEHGHPLDPVIFQLARIMSSRGASEDQITAVMADALERHPRLRGVRAALAHRYALAGRLHDADALYADNAELEQDARLARDAAVHAASTGRPERAVPLLERADRLARADADAPLMLEIAEAWRALAQPTRAAALETEAFAHLPSDAAKLAGARHAARLGDRARAADFLAEALDHDPTPGMLADGAAISEMLGDVEGARTYLLESARRSAGDAWTLASIGARLRALADLTGDGASLDQSLILYAQAVALQPDSPTLHHDRGATLFGAGRDDEAVAELEQACRLDPDRPVYPARLAAMLDQLGRHEEADTWRQEAARRGRMPHKPGS